MDAISTQETPEAVHRLATHLKSDCGGQATLTITPEGYSHARSQQKFSLILVGKHLILNALFAHPDVSILKVQTKRTGPNVRTTVNLKVDSASAHPQTTC